MNTYQRFVRRMMVAAVAAVASLQAQPAASQGEEKPETRRELRVLAGPGDAAGAARASSARPFLGVETARVGAALAAQLGLHEGVGLVVAAVVPDSPAAAVLQRHDVLVKFNDQWLTSPDHLGVLVRAAGEGAEVTLSYLRGGQAGTTQATLRRREVAVRGGLERWQLPEGLREKLQGATMQMRRLETLPREEVEHVLSLVGEDGGDRLRGVAFRTGETPLARIVNVGNANLVFSDEQGALELTVTDGRKHLVAKDAGGAVLFDGPINTTEERAAMPEAVRGRLEQMESIDTLRVRPGESFRDGDVRVLVPRGDGV